MGRRILIVLLALGTVTGFALGFSRMCGYHRFGHGWYGHGYGPDASFEDRAAEACVRAAERVRHEPSSPPVKGPAPAPAPAPPPASAQ